MKIKNIILILKVSFLLSVFAAATFYFQYAALKKAYSISCTKDQASEKNAASLPLTEEEETENEKSSEEEQDDVRFFHRLEFIHEQSLSSTITFSTVHLMAFKEIHFEIVTPPPQS
jgi:hypothetical protein